MAGLLEAYAKSARFGELDVEFAQKLDLWGAYFRLCVAVPGLVIALVVLPEQPWVARMLAAYLVVGLCVPDMLRASAFVQAMPRVRPLLVLLDVALVSTLVYGWGTQISPATFMYVTVVVGWTLVPQRGLGLLSLVLSLAGVLIMLLLERAGVIPVAPAGSGAVAPGGPVLFFSLLTAALTAVHGLVHFVVARLAEHVLQVAALRAEKEAREREVAWALKVEEKERLEALGRLAGGVAHDFNNLLTALIGFSELARMKLRDDPRIAEHALGEIQQAAERASQLTAQLVDFASRRATQSRPVELRDELKRSAALLERLLGEGVALHVVATRSCVCRIDPAGLERVLVNLAVNARDAMPTGGSLRIELERDQRDALLTVSDTGTGIAARDLPRIFEPFFTTKTRGRGAGLGLSSVYGLVKQSGGSIDVRSEEGRGTSFLIRIPLCEADPAAPVVDLPLARRGGTLLLVDDQREVRTVTRAHLEAAGYTVHEAASGPEAVTLAGEHAITALISDVAMPGMNGLELARALRAERPTLPVLFISGYSDADIAAHESLPEGARFLAKPFTSARLERALSELLERT